MTNTEKKLVDFFQSHPEATVVFVAAGVLFTDLEKANAFCGGTAAKPVTFTKDQVEAFSVETPAEEVTASVEEEKVEAPDEEEKVEAPAEEVAVSVEEEKVEAPAEEAKVEAPAEEAKEEAPAEEIAAPVEEKKVDEKPAAPPVNNRRRNNK